MAAELYDLLSSLTALIEAENDALVAPGPLPDIREAMTAKARLVAELERHLLLLDESEPGWAKAMSEEERGRLAGAIGLVRDAAAGNATLISRFIEISSGMIAAVSAEIQRLSGARVEGYGATGQLHRTDRASPIALNRRL